VYNRVKKSQTKKNVEKQLKLSFKLSQVRKHFLKKKNPKEFNVYVYKLSEGQIVMIEK